MKFNEGMKPGTFASTIFSVTACLSKKRLTILKI